MIPKKEIPSIAESTQEDQKLLGHLMLKATEIARKCNIDEKGYRLVINTKEDGGQTVNHLHIHILGGCPLSENMTSKAFRPK